MTVENLLCGWHVVANIRKNNQYMDSASDTGLSLPRHIIITQRKRERERDSKSATISYLFQSSTCVNGIEFLTDFHVHLLMSYHDTKEEEGRKEDLCVLAAILIKKEIQFSARSNS
jgi:hypothetical protein